MISVDKVYYICNYISVANIMIIPNTPKNKKPAPFGTGRHRLFLLYIEHHRRTMGPEFLSGIFSVMCSLMCRVEIRYLSQTVLPS